MTCCKMQCEIPIQMHDVSSELTRTGFTQQLVPVAVFWTSLSQLKHRGQHRSTFPQASVTSGRPWVTQVVPPQSSGFPCQQQHQEFYLCTSWHACTPRCLPVKHICSRRPTFISSTQPIWSLTVMPMCSRSLTWDSAEFGASRAMTGTISSVNPIMNKRGRRSEAKGGTTSSDIICQPL
jgi:hypothetical protein